MNPVGTVCVFCGSRDGVSPQYVDAARELGTELARRGAGLVYGGGTPGLMGAVANGALDADGHVEGVIPRGLFSREVPHEDLSKLHVVASMHERKALMHELSDAFVILPGGFGTYEEFFEIVTWRQLGIHDKPIVVVDIDGYYAPLTELVRHGHDSGFLGDRELFVTVPTVAEALAVLGL